MEKNNFLKVTCYDYKGGELNISIKSKITDLIDTKNKEGLEELENDMDTLYAGGDEGNPTQVFTIKDGKIISLSFMEIEKLIEKAWK